MERHASLRFRLALLSLLGCLAAGAAWVAELAGVLAMPTRREGKPVAANARPDANPHPPRLFLARDRVRRLPPVTEPTARAAGGPVPATFARDPLPGGHEVNTPAGPDLLKPIGGSDSFPDPPATPTSDAVVVERSEQMEQVARQADRHTRRGFELGGRNAFFAARAQFILALRLLAQGLDADHGTGRYSRALAEGLDAIQEADDFIPRGGRIEADLDLPVLVRGHRTVALTQEQVETLTPMLAMKAYFTYAQEQLSAAVAHEVAGSMALHGLGKLHAAIARDPAIHLTAPEPKAVAFFQAALLVYPQNLMAANDLGVLLARSGNWDGARRVLEHAVATNPHSVSWRNLERVYEQLGNAPMARHARQMAQAVTRGEAGQHGRTHGAGHVQWLAPNAFAGTHVDTRVIPTPRTGRGPSHVPLFPTR